MTAELRRTGRLLLRTRAGLPPLAAALLVLGGIYAGARNPVEATFAATAPAVGAIVALLVVAVAAAEPPAQRWLLLSLAGARRARRDRALATGALAAAVGVVVAVLPLLLADFARPLTAGDVAASVLAHVACAWFGAAAGSLVAAPVVGRPAVSAALLLVAAMGLVLLASVLPAAGGPAWIASRLLDDPGDPAAAVALPSALAGAEAALVAWAGVVVQPRREGRGG